jgi:hypothetical protein
MIWKFDLVMAMATETLKNIFESDIIKDQQGNSLVEIFGRLKNMANM